MSATSIKENPASNIIGYVCTALALVGVIGLWFFPNHFFGTWEQIGWIAFIGGLSFFAMIDDLLKKILNKFSPKNDKN